MSGLKIVVWLLLGLVLISAAGVLVVVNPFGASPFNRYEKNGALALPGLKAPVTVQRDEKGMAFVRAQNLDDLWLAQGFVTAQDRLFQMALTRLFASGRISELIGPAGSESDARMRTLGFRRHAERHAGLLGEKSRRFLQSYADGVNAFMRSRPQEIHLEFKLSGLTAEPWSIADSLTILHFMGWNSAANLNSEIIAQMLVEKLGPSKAAEIFPINVNPDAEGGPSGGAGEQAPGAGRLGIEADRLLRAYLEEGPLRVGSNNWVAGAALSASGKPVVANDPHLEANILPGPWYPCGLIAPGVRAVGVAIPGIGGMTIGRTEHIALGVTNAYGDTQDLYIESVDPADPQRYLEGSSSIPFEVIEETIKIRDRTAPDGFREEKITVRATRRGPVVSGLLPGVGTDKLVSLRWSSFEAMAPVLGFEEVIACRSVAEVRAQISNLNQIALNFVIADSQGGIGWQTTGKIPIRTQGQSLLPFEVKDGRDNWTGWIPWPQMPHALDPARGWVGTCNHLTVGPGYPYHYSTYAAPSFRYRRLAELMDAPGQKSADDHWRYQLDAVNLLAREIAPRMAQALTAHDDTRRMGRLLAEWDCVDSPEQAAPTVFQAVYREFARLVFADELGEELALSMLKNWSFWQERLLAMVRAGESPWFDIVSTADKNETLDDLLHMAATKAAGALNAALGDDPAGWLWGKVHVHEFISPIRRGGFGKGWLGAGSHPARGSDATLCRGIYDFGAPYKVSISASLRMVVDFADPDKIMAVLPGGVAGRQFDPHTTDQVAPFMNGEKRYWWFSDQAIDAHARDTLRLNPE
ncbi:MAG: penicillin acylase family protein [Desulfobacterales bacterium]